MWKVCISMAIISRDIIRALQAPGWVHVATKDGHWRFKHPDRPGRATVPHPKRGRAPRTVASIERQAGMTIRPLQ